MADVKTLVNAAPWDGEHASCSMCANAVATWCVGGEGWCADCLARAAINAVSGETARAEKAEAALAEARVEGLREAAKIVRGLCVMCGGSGFHPGNYPCASVVCDAADEILARIKEAAAQADYKARIYAAITLALNGRAEGLRDAIAEGMRIATAVPVEKVPDAINAFLARAAEREGGEHE